MAEEVQNDRRATATTTTSKNTETRDDSPYVDGYLRWLEELGYQPHSICCHRYYLGQFLNWAENEHVSLVELGPTTVEEFCIALKAQGNLRTKDGRYVPAVSAARRFVEYLISAGVAPDRRPAAVPLPRLLSDFEQWMRENRGVRESTLNTYRRVLLDLLEVLGEEPDMYRARDLRDFVLRRASSWGRSRTKMDVTAARMFLRFLGATGKSPTELVEALPTIAHWRLSALPRHLSPADLERVVEASDSTSEQGVRDRAVILLLTRLGLRSSDVAGLRLGDIDWKGGRLLLEGKGRREVWMPLSQEVGDALLDYLDNFRPAVNNDHVFVTVTAPRRTMSSQNCKHIAARAIRRAGVKAPSHGAHLLRHSAATSMLAQGLPLEAIGAVLRHRSIQTTAHYAKVDQQLLETVAMPWPEVASC